MTDSLISKPRLASVPVVCIIISVINILVFVLQQFSPALLGPQVDMTTLGANIAQLTLTGDYWRYLSNIFLHGSIMHLLFNTLALLVIGLQCERFYGHLRTLVLYLTTGIGASLVSALWYADGGVEHSLIIFQPRLLIVLSVGASGAIMGLAGASLLGLLKSNLDGQQFKKAISSVGSMIGFTLFYGMQGGIDNAAHIGGVIFGLLAGGGFLALNSFTRNTLAGLLASIGMIFAACFLCVAANKSHDEEKMELRTEVLNYLAQQTEQKVQHQEAALRQQKATELHNSLPAPVDEAQARGLPLDMESPMAIASSSDGQTLYAALPDTNTLATIDVTTHKITRTLHAPKLPKYNDGCSGNVCRGVGASGVAVSSDGKTLYAASMVPNSFSIIDITSGEIKKNIAVGQFPRTILLTPDDKRAFVMNSLDNTISAIDLTSQTLIKTIPLPGGSADFFPYGRPLALAMSHDGKLVAVSDAPGAQLILLDTQTLALKIMPLTNHEDFTAEAMMFGPEGDTLWLADRKNVLQLDVAKGHLLSEMQWSDAMDASKIISMRFSLIQHRLAVTTYDSLYMIDPQTGVATGRYPASHYSSPMLDLKDGVIILSTQKGVDFFSQKKSLLTTDTTFYLNSPAQQQDDRSSPFGY